MPRLKKSTLALKVPELVEGLKRENAHLRAYLRAFVRVCYDERVVRGKEGEEARKADELFRVNPGMTFICQFNDTAMEGTPLITGRQILRAMELLGEVVELPPAEEAKNTYAMSLLRNVHSTLAMAADKLAPIAEQHGLKSLLAHLEDMADATSPTRVVPPFRTGDIVLHKPTGESRTVAWADPEDGFVRLFGRPLAAQPDVFELQVAASDEWHRTALLQLKRSGGPVAEKALAYYGDPEAQA